jgi:hypothetical protein
MRPMRVLRSALVVLTVLPGLALGRGSGVSGYTLKTNAAGCGLCHTSASQNANVTIFCPTFMNTSAAAQCTVLVAGSTTGVDIASSAGALAPVFRLKSLNSELTHPSAGTGVYVFTFAAPSSPGTVTLYATGVSGGFSGSWAHAPNATITIASVASVEQDIPSTFALEQNYPNPFNPTTSIAYSLPATEHVSLVVFDLNGRVAATLVDAVQSAGSYRLAFNAAGLASGIYLARLTAGSQSAMRKLVLLK